MSIYDDAGSQWNVDPLLLQALERVESSGNVNATSPAGAQGNMQFMPGTAAAQGVANPRYPSFSVPGAAKMLDSLLTGPAKGDLNTALRMYQGGTDRSKWGKQNAAYAQKVASAYQTLLAAQGPSQATANFNPANASLDDLDKRLGGGMTTPAAPAGNPGSMSIQDLDKALSGPIKEEAAQAPESTAPGATAQPAPKASNDLTTYEGLSNALAPAPNTTYGNVLPLAKDDVTGQIRLALPNSLRSLAQGMADLAHGPQTGTVTPEGTAALATIAPSLAPSVAAGTYGLINGSATQLVRGPGGQNVLAAMPPGGEVNPLSARIGIPSSSAEAKQVASTFYKQADQSGGVLTPQFTNKFIDSVTSKLPQTEAGKIVGGPSSTSNLVDRLSALRDKPMSIQEAQEVDEALGDLVSKEYSTKGLTADGKKISDIQSAFRNQIAGADEGDVQGGAGGFDALSNARKAWSQAMKMRDLERIQERADMTDNPQTSVKTQLRALLTNPARIRGYSPEEVDALKAATERGVMGSLYHVFGSRLAPLAAGAAEFGTGGLTGGVASALAMHGVSSAMRNAASRQAAQRLQNAMQILGRNVPSNPLSAP